MIRSMTGFGAASVDEDGTRYALEIRTLNGKYLKAQVRLPEDLQGLEAELDSALSRRISRGSAVLVLKVTDLSAGAAATVNVAAVQRYLQQLLAIEGVGSGGVRVDLGALLVLPGVLVEPTTDLLDRARPIAMTLLEEACAKLIGMREREGATLLRELHRHCDVIAGHLVVVEEHVPKLIELYQAKLRLRMESMLAEIGGAVREEDLLREVAVFAERSDVAEEVARLHGHLDQFRELVDGAGEEPVGRTLDFLAQEMLREANTIGSKCLDGEVSRRIVEIKGSIDRLKEQVQNVE